MHFESSVGLFEDCPQYSGVAVPKEVLYFPDSPNRRAACTHIGRKLDSLEIYNVNLERMMVL